MMNSADERFCYDKALSLLARVEHSRKGLERKLLKKGFSGILVTKILDRLEDESSLSDARYARLWVEFRLRSRKDGARLLLEGLVSRGIDRRLAEKVVTESQSGQPYKDSLRRAYEASLKKGDESDIEIRSRLYKRGFTAGEIRAFLEDEH